VAANIPLLEALIRRSGVRQALWRCASAGILALATRNL